MKACRFIIAFSLIATAALNDSNGDEQADIAQREVKAFEAIVLKWVAAVGSADETRLDKQMEVQRAKIIKVGEPAIPHLCELLKHKQVNVRRGSAIALSFIIQNEKVKDEKLLDYVLLRMVEDEDIKARSNLYHAANAIIDNQKLRQSSDNPSPN